MRYYKESHTLVDEEEIELDTDYGNYMVVVAVETMVFPSRISRKKFITIYEIGDEVEEKGGIYLEPITPFSHRRLFQMRSKWVMRSTT
jgi:hypothetical protein